MGQRALCAKAWSDLLNLFIDTFEPSLQRKLKNKQIHTVQLDKGYMKEFYFHQLVHITTYHQIYENENFTACNSIHTVWKQEL